jgi:cob(I)alamin adenosyltransferase
MSSDLGKIQIYTGDGKGKTTAGLGLAMRALGRGMRVRIIYFDKGGDNYGERKILDELKNKFSVSYEVTGLDRIDSVTKVFRFGVNNEDRQEAIRGLELVKKIFIDNDCDLLILDELNSTLGLKMLEVKEVLEVLDLKPENMEVVMTGRNCPDEVLERADLVTEMKMIKHYFEKGVKARKGIEF